MLTHLMCDFSQSDGSCDVRRPFKFMYWLKIKIGLEPVTELSAGEYLEDRRREQPSYLGPSFATKVMPAGIHQKKTFRL